MLSDVEEVDTEDFDELVDCNCVELVALIALCDEELDSSYSSACGAKTNGWLRFPILLVSTTKISLGVCSSGSKVGSVGLKLDVET